MNGEKKRKTIILTFIGALILLLLVVGGTYAFFQIVSEGNTSSNFKGQADTLSKYGTPILKNQSELYLYLSASDMAFNKVNTKYYATLKTEPQEKNHEAEKQNHVISTASVERQEVEDAVEDGYLRCTSELTITISGSMKDVLETGDGKIYLGTKSDDGNKGSVSPKEFDLAELVSKQESGENKVTVNYGIAGYTSVDVTADIEIVNREDIQNALAGKDIEITIANNNLSCSVSEPPTMAEVLMETSGGSLTADVGGMYRYQGTNNVPNWICFGTKDPELCKMDYNKYLYRIIGVTPEGQLYLIKETFLKENLETGFAWNAQYTLSSCPGGVCPEWKDADLFKRINGTANGSKVGSTGNTDIFVDSEYYDYLKSGDNVNGGEGASEWYKLIDTHSWYYGDTTTTNQYNGNEMYKIENGRVETTHYVKSSSGSVVGQDYRWQDEDKVEAKISLMYIHDVDYAYSGGVPGSYGTVQYSWIHFQKDGYNSSPTTEWLSTRWGITGTSNTNVIAWILDNNGLLRAGIDGLSIAYGVRPVFYVSNKAKISDGLGTKEEPYTLEF